MPASKIVCNPLFHQRYTEHCDDYSTTMIIAFLTIAWAVIATNFCFYIVVIISRRRKLLALRKSVLS